MADIHVTGLAELNQFLQELPVKIERNVLRGALRAGVKPIRDAAIAACPMGLPSNEGRRLYKLYEGALRDSIRITTRTKGGTVTATVSVGGKNKKTGADVWYAHLFEFTGARAHVVRSWKGPLFFLGRFAKSVDHPGMRPKPFMRPSLDQQAENAVIAAAEYMKKRLATKEGLDTSAVLIEGDE